MSSAQRLVGMSAGVAAFVLGVVIAPAVSPAAAPPLRYGVQPGSEIGYSIKIEAAWKEYTETYEGRVLYGVVSANGEQFELRFAGGLQATSVAREGVAVAPLPIDPRPPSGLGPQTITLGRRGNWIDSYPLTPLPYVIGDLEMLVFEEFPEQPQDNWHADHEIVIKESKFGGLAALPHTPGTKRGGTERVEYCVTTASSDVVHITKKHTLSTPAGDMGGATNIDSSGSGQFTFDLRRGLIESLAMTYQFTTQKSAQPETAVVTINYRLLDANELATLSKQVAATRQREEEASLQAYEDEKYPQFRGLRGEERLLAKLRSPDLEAVTETLGELAKTPANSRSSAVAKAIAPYLQHKDVMVKQYAAQALIHWGTHDVETEIVKATQSSEHWVAEYARQALAAVRSLPRLSGPVDAVYRTWSDSTGRFKIEAQLVSLQDEMVMLQTKGGQRVQIELSKLSQADQAYIRQQSASPAAAAGNAAPSASAGAAPLPTAPTRPAAATDLTPVNLLARIDPKRDQIRGVWKLEGGNLVTPTDQTATLVIPWTVPQQYRLTIVAERMAGKDSLNVGLIVGGRQTMLVLEGWGVGASGLNTVNGRTADNNETTFRSPVFTAGRPATIVCTVRTSSVQVSCNGQGLVNWSGNAERLALDRRFWANIPTDKLFLGTWQTTFHISRLELVPLAD